MRYGAAVAASGLTGGTALETTVFPFITRDVALLGVDSVQTPAERRRRVCGTPRHRSPAGCDLDALIAGEVPLTGWADALDESWRHGSGAGCSSVPTLRPDGGVRSAPAAGASASDRS